MENNMPVKNLFDLTRIMLAAVCILLAAFVIPHTGQPIVSEMGDRLTGEYVLQELKEGDILIQPFTTGYDRLYEVSLYFIHQPELEQGTLCLTVETEEGHIIAEAERALREMPNADWVRFPFNAVLDPGKTFRLCLRISKTAENESVFFVMADHLSTAGTEKSVTLNGEEISGYVYSDFLFAMPRALLSLTATIALVAVAICILVYELVKLCIHSECLFLINLKGNP